MAVGATAMWEGGLEFLSSRHLHLRPRERTGGNPKKLLRFPAIPKIPISA
jgi:hypothetical protein